MTKISELIDYLHLIAPNHLQEEYDNSGLIVGNEHANVKSVLISLDCTEQVVDEAIALGANLIVSHHPIVFRGLKRFTGKTYIERVVEKAIKNDIALFSIHTNLDNVALDGVNGKICDVLEIENTAILKHKNGDPQTGAGMIGEIQPKNAMDFLAHVKQKMGLKVIKHTSLCKPKIAKVAVCGGSGSFLLQDAVKAGADVFITSDFKYHEFFDAEDSIIIMDIGHFESERFTIDLLYALISNKFANFAAHCTKVDTNPVKYF